MIKQILKNNIIFSKKLFSYPSYDYVHFIVNCDFIEVYITRKEQQRKQNILVIIIEMAGLKAAALTEWMTSSCS